ncbi:TonB-dependent receptor [Sandaracinobacteroides hominis]|uniref:TonB-dependent receptor n=1 Tax=Sandaracinobacteroides hominis TaxID=2780086 RepID=UPI001F1ADEDF|nr:TonB-dependent receptor [Sandaracinobacteroides hominis]
MNIRFWLTASVAALVPVMPARAQTTETSGDGLEDIIVTAQRRSQDLRDVPISITAANAETLANARVDNVSNIQAISPSISFRVTNIASSSANLIIRGLGTTGNSRSFEGSVGVFIDGVYRTRAAAALNNFLDIDNLQVLRGPQGTLFGKNTTAGALLLTSAAPSLDGQSGLLDVTAGNYHTVIARGAVNLPVNDKLAVRIAAMSSLQDGFYTDSTSGRPLNNNFSYAAKGQILFEPVETVSIRLIADYSKSEGDCCYATSNYIDGPTQPLINALTLANGRKLPSTKLGDFEATLSTNGDQEIEDYGGTLLVDVDVGDDTIKSVTALRWFKVGQVDMDAEFSGADILILDETFRSKFFSQELTFNGHISSLNTDYVLGAFFSDERINMSRDIDWGKQAQVYWNTLLAAQGLPPGTGKAAAGLVAAEAMRGTSKSYAGFAHANADLGGGFSLLAGIRYSVEEKTGSFDYDYYDPSPNAVFRVLGVSPGPSYDDSRTSKAFSGTFGGQFKPNDDVMLYATYNRGFKAGGVNMDSNGAGTVLNNPAIVPGAVPLDPTYDPETVNAYEIGAKTEYWGGRARTNISFFYYDISNMQVAQFVGLRFTVLNAKSAKDYGVEIENTFKLSDALILNLDGTWIPEAKMGEDANIDPVLSGQRFRFAPKFQGNAAINLDTPLNDDMNLVGRVQYQYSGPQYINTASLARRDAVGLVNANLGIRLHSGVTAEVWAQNLFDEIYPSQLFATPLQTGDQNAYLAPPRTFGVRFRATF